MTVLENVLVGAVHSQRNEKRAQVEEAMECLKLLNLLGAKDTLSTHLTYSDRRLVEIARAIAARPGLALLDEPLAGLNPAETEKVMGIIQRVRESRGVSILWIEHKIDAVFNLCDRVVVLDYGKKLAEGKPGEVASDQRVVEAYLGEPIA
jgi:branched-chain amino acid transport system ATP-binding protein